MALDPISVVIGVIIGVFLAELAEAFIESRAHNREMRRSAVEKRQC